MDPKKPHSLSPFDKFLANLKPRVQKVSLQISLPEPVFQALNKYYWEAKMQDHKLTKSWIVTAALKAYLEMPEDA
jgi:hypothetical protein